MFCLRSWVPLLVFLTNTAPIYVLLFLLANYALQRPCVYCSILLFVLVFSLFDFGADWFEPRRSLSGTALGSVVTHVVGAVGGTRAADDPTALANATSNTNANTTVSSLANLLVHSASALLGGAAGAAAGGEMVGVTSRNMSNATGASPPVDTDLAAAGSSAFEWLRGLVEKRQARIPCVEVMVGI